MGASSELDSQFDLLHFLAELQAFDVACHHSGQRILDKSFQDNLPAVDQQGRFIRPSLVVVNTSLVDEFGDLGRFIQPEDIVEADVLLSRHGDHAGDLTAQLLLSIGDDFDFGNLTGLPEPLPDDDIGITKVAVGQGGEGQVLRCGQQRHLVGCHQHYFGGAGIRHVEADAALLAGLDHCDPQPLSLQMRHHAGGKRGCAAVMPAYE
jgi:hypothetical protein